MKRVEPADLEAAAERFDRIVTTDPRVDPFCTRMAWQLSFHRAFDPERALWLAQGERFAVLLAETQSDAGFAYLEPLENMWGFASPLVGEGAADAFARWLLERPLPAMLLGLPDERARLQPIAERLSKRYRVRLLDPTTRFVADLRGGLDGWLAGRSPKFRRNLRASLRRVEAAGLRFDPMLAPTPDEVGALYETILGVESRTWKSAEGNGADKPPMRDFYADLLPRLAARGELRVLLVRDETSDVVGYLHGGLCGWHFRGLQFSFDERHRNVGLGNALQYHTLAHLVAEGARTYDLGSRSAYKSRWAAPDMRTIGMILRPV